MMFIDRDNLIQEMMLRKHVRGIIKESSFELVKTHYPESYQQYLNEQELRKAIRSRIPAILKEELSQQEMQDFAIGKVTDTLKSIIPQYTEGIAGLSGDLQPGFKKYMLMAFDNLVDAVKVGKGMSDEALAPIEEKVEVDLGTDEQFTDEQFIEVPDEEEFDPEKAAKEAEKAGDEALQRAVQALSKEEALGAEEAADLWPQLSTVIKNTLEKLSKHPEIMETYVNWLRKNLALHADVAMEKTAATNTPEDVTTA